MNIYTRSFVDEMGTAVENSKRIFYVIFVIWSRVQRRCQRTKLVLRYSQD